VTTRYRVLDVSTSGHDAWQKRAGSPRSRDVRVLTERGRRDRLRSRVSYGAPRIHAGQCNGSEHVRRKRVARLMRVAELQGVSRGRPWERSGLPLRPTWSGVISTLAG
jgi:hypothetical protein